MLDYETLDAIADSYVPFLAVLSLGCLGWSLGHRRWRQFGGRALLLFCGLIIAYGLMFVDALLRLWPALGLDYSTHSAVAFVLVVVLIVVLRKLWRLWALSLVGYILLMLYQRYHSLLDVVSTIAVVAACYVPAAVWYRRRLRI